MDRDSDAARSEAELLAEVNRGLPVNVDWKVGAISSLRHLHADQGEAAETYHLIKPFLGGRDYRPSFEDTFLFLFLDGLEHLTLPARSPVIDVARGPGWISRWMARFGYDVAGIDVSPDGVTLAGRLGEEQPLLNLSRRAAVGPVRRGRHRIEPARDDRLLSVRVGVVEIS